MVFAHRLMRIQVEAAIKAERAKCPRLKCWQICICEHVKGETQRCTHQNKTKPKRHACVIQLQEERCEVNNVKVRNRARFHELKLNKICPPGGLP